MENTIIERSIEINAPVEKVWSVFTDAEVTREIGGEYVTDWKVGSSFGWKGLDGNMYTQGNLLEFETNKLLKHNLTKPGEETVASIITYELVPSSDNTILNAREELTYSMDEEEMNGALEGWDFALMSVKDAAENIC